MCLTRNTITQSFLPHAEFLPRFRRLPRHPVPHQAQDHAAQVRRQSVDRHAVPDGENALTILPLLLEPPLGEHVGAPGVIAFCYTNPESQRNKMRLISYQNSYRVKACFMERVSQYFAINNRISGNINSGKVGRKFIH